MKRTLLFFCALIFFVFTCFNRYTPITLQEAKPTLMQVEIKGAVKNPGVYTLKFQDTISSLINASGGLLENGDDSSLSYTQVLKDKDVIVIPEKKEQPKISGPSIASRIIEYRKNNTFQTLEQIKEVKGIGDGLFNKIKDDICL